MSRSGTPVTRVDESNPESATAAVPWMSSLNVHTSSRQRASSANALWLPKSSNCRHTRGKRSCTARTNSSSSASYSAPRTRGCRRPTYDSDSRRRAFSVPTSIVIGRHWCGGMPAQAVYSVSLPMGMPMPCAPRSPRPRIRSPSVTTIMRMSSAGQFASTSATRPRSSEVM